MAEAQFRAFAGGDTDRYFEYFSEEGSRRLMDVIGAREEHGMGVPAGEAPFKIPFAISLVPEEMISFEVTAQAREGIFATVDVEIVYPEPRALVHASMDTVRDWGFGRLVAAMETDEANAMRQAWEADLRERMRVQYQRDPARFRRSLRGRYVLSPTFNGWRVDADPIALTAE